MQIYFKNVGTLTNLGFTDLFKNVGTLTNLGFADLFKNRTHIQ
ncbi:hypothetical protein LEP1GSC089_2708 [Leptospira interrogans serovar Autumnalis str. LP101]|nr:hypothetical protein LEP1GSC089_2708 [Leptospira interrogans serovar Autumnalis str. LP101]